MLSDAVNILSNGGNIDSIVSATSVDTTCDLPSTSLPNPSPK